MDALQRGGRAIRQSDDDALFVIFYESWVLDINLEDYSTGDLLDPDRPRKNLHDHSQRRDRAPYASVKLILDKICLRIFFADYLGDTLPGGLPNRLLSLQPTHLLISFHSSPFYYHTLLRSTRQ